MRFAAKIGGIGSAFPATRITNEDIALRLSKKGIFTSDQWIRERTGIKQRRHSDTNIPEERNSALAAKAALKALEMAGKTPRDIDQILYATCSPDTRIPSSACWLQKRIGASRAWAMDLNAACSGFIYGLAIANQFISSGAVRTSLVVGAELLHPLINWDDRTTCILFGDGAGAAIVECTDIDSTSRIISSSMLSEGNLSDLLYIPAGGSNLELTPERFRGQEHKVRMKGKEIFKVAVRILEKLALRQLGANNMGIKDLDWFVPHQANRRIIEAVAGRLGISMDKVIINLDRYGNTSSATIPTAIDEAVRDGRIQRGQTLLLDAFGAGLTYGAMLIRW